MDSKKNHSLRKKLDRKIIELVKPESMTAEEYCIACNIEDFEPSVENGSYLHWLVTSSGDDIDVDNTVKLCLLNALEKKYLLDTSSIEQMSYFCDAVKDVCLKDREWTTELIVAVLKSYKGTEVFNFCKSLNKAFGYTSLEYFS